MKIKIYLGFVVGIALLSGCNSEPIGQIPTNNTAPNTVSNPKVVNTPGGATITYDLPDDEDLLYVKAEYHLIGGTIAEVKSSVYTNKLEIQGFGDTTERDVLLYAVDRSGNHSTPLSVKVTPLEPPVYTVFRTLSIIPDFGGISFSWKNENEANISISLLHKKADEYVSLETVNSNRVDGRFSVRGLEPEEGEFALNVRDRWNNFSDTLYATLTPLFEMRIPNDRIRPYKMTGDTPDEWGWTLNKIWDGQVGTGFHTEITSGPWPHRFTFQMLDGPIKVSRFKIYQRNGEWYYRHGNIKKFELYGSNTPNADGSYDGWESMGTFESFKPSGTPPGQITNEDLDYISNGEEFMVNPELPAYKFFRIKVTESWSGANFLHLMELPFWGSPENYVPESATN